MIKLTEKVRESSREMESLSDNEVRISYNRFPRFTQHFWTWLTGKPLPGQKPLFVLNAWWHWILTVFVLITSVGMNILTVTYKPFLWQFFLVVTWLFTVGSARKLQAVICHHCVHYRFTKNILVDRFIAEISSLLIWGQNFLDYRYDHVFMHHKKCFFRTTQDPDANLLFKLGFRPGMSKKALWFNLLRQVFSPGFHLNLFSDRVKSNFITAPIYRIIFSICFALLLITGITLSNLSWQTGFLVLFVPLFPLLHISALLQFLSEHAWFVKTEYQGHPRFFHTDSSWGRFCGDRLPITHNLGVLQKSAAWVKWVLRQLFYHLPMRITVLPGDLSQHDFHHRYPVESNWVMAVYARQQDIEKNHPNWPVYQECWGLFRAIDRMFTYLLVCEALPEISSDTPRVDEPLHHIFSG